MMSQNKNNPIKIFLWSPMLSNVGTNVAMIGMAQSLKKYSNAEIYLINVLGEFTKYKTENFYSLNFFNINNLIPKTGKISKYLIFFFSIISIPFLIKKILKHRPNIIIAGLVGFIPCMLKFFFNDLMVVNSIQGYPKLNFIRKIIWKIFYKKSDYLITMTKQTRKDLVKNIGINSEKIFTIQNPIRYLMLVVQHLVEHDGRVAEWMIGEKYQSFPN